MKPRTQVPLAIAFLIMIFGITIFTLWRQNREPLRFFSATIDRDCAPWDGSAFTLSIPIEKETIAISIYRSPDIRLPVTFSFLDETTREGHAVLLRPAGVPEALTGTVSLGRVEQEEDVRGEFNLATDSGQHFAGKFEAVWGSEIVYCG